jgi:catechol 2,3-dioxygenase-like lactoylglutathione lyase family enzyme
MSIGIDRLDHVVVNCRDVEAMATWYERVLGMTREVFGPDRRIALKFGNQKLNLRPTQAPNWPTGQVDAPGSLDFCFITTMPPVEVLSHFKSCGVQVTDGPMLRMGALGPMTSIYCRDPDGNLVEIANYAAVI